MKICKNCKFRFEKVAVTVTTTFKSGGDKSPCIVTYKVAPTSLRVSCMLSLWSRVHSWGPFIGAFPRWKSYQQYSVILPEWMDQPLPNRVNILILFLCLYCTLKQARFSTWPQPATCSAKMLHGERRHRLISPKETGFPREMYKQGRRLRRSRRRRMYRPNLEIHSCYLDCRLQWISLLKVLQQLQAVGSRLAQGELL